MLAQQGVGGGDGSQHGVGAGSQVGGAGSQQTGAGSGAGSQQTGAGSQHAGAGSGSQQAGAGSGAGSQHGVGAGSQHAGSDFLKSFFKNPPALASGVRVETKQKDMAATTNRFLRILILSNNKTWMIRLPLLRSANGAPINSTLWVRSNRSDDFSKDADQEFLIVAPPLTGIDLSLPTNHAL